MIPLKTSLQKEFGNFTAEAPRTQRKEFLIKKYPISVYSASLWMI